jgi:hypothetical protein
MIGLQRILEHIRQGSRTLTGAKLARKRVISGSKPLSSAPKSDKWIQTNQLLTSYAGPCQGWGRGFESPRPLQIPVDLNALPADGPEEGFVHWREASRTADQWRVRRSAGRRRDRVRSCGGRATCSPAVPPLPKPECRSGASSAHCMPDGLGRSAGSESGCIGV